MSRKELIEAYLAANHAGPDVRGEVSKTITAYNRANKNDVITTADVIEVCYPSIYKFLSEDGALEDKEILENSFRKLLANLDCLTRVFARSTYRVHCERLSSKALFTEVYGNGNATFYSQLYPSLTFKVNLTSYYKCFVCVQNPSLTFGIDEGLPLMREF